MALSPQQLLILKTMAPITGFTDFNELAEKAEIKAHGSVKTQLNRMKDLGLVTKEEEKSTKWQTTEKGIELLKSGETEEVEAEKQRVAAAEQLLKEKEESEKEGTIKPVPEPEVKPGEDEPKDRIKTGQSQEELKLTPYQIFLQMGRDMGGIGVEKLRGITDVVFGDNPDSLDRVWHSLSAMNVAIDLKKQWFTLWQNYLRQAGKPGEISDELQSEITPPAKRTQEQVKVAEAAGRDFDVIEGENGLWKSTNCGGGLGEYTFAQANKEVIARNVALTRNQTGSPQEPLSQVLIALGPYLNKESKQDSIASVLTALAPYLKDDAVTTKLEEMKTAVTNAQANSGKGGLAEILKDLPRYAETLKTMAPIIRAMLGVPEHPAAPNQAAQTAVQLQNPDGTPMVMSLDSYFSIEKFKAEQKHEDDSAKGKQEFIKTVQGFIGKIGNAAEKAAGAK